jgi:PhnB protein
MAITSLNPYLNFNGSAREALSFYEKALGAKVAHVMRFADGPPDMKVPPEAREQVMHAELSIDGQRLMLSDAMPGMSLPTTSNIQVCLGLDDNADMKRKFDALAVGGRVCMPIHDAFWGATFGMVTDKFGVSWMFVGPKR